MAPITSTLTSALLRPGGGRGVVMLLLAVSLSLVAGCGDDTTKTGTSNNGVNNGTNNATNNGTNNPTNNETNNPTNNANLDADSDGVLDDVDNCPDDANTTQTDSDGDGIGDVCDACPTFDDPTNDPATCAPQMEVEPNGDETLGDTEWTLPMIVQGSVGPPIDGQPDVDYYSVELQPGQALRVRLEAHGGDFWGAVIIFGYDITNYNVQRVLTGTNFNTTNTREIFITRPGPYAFLVSDIRNLVAAPEATGGESGYDYLLTVTEFDIEPTGVEELPFATIETFDERLRVYGVEKSLADAIRISAESTSFDPSAFMIPTLSAYDPGARAVLAESNTDTAQETQSASLIALASGEGELWVVLDPVQGFGPNATDVTINGLAADMELEPNDDVTTASPFIVPGEIPGRIDPPVADPVTNTLRADLDYFVFLAAAGDLLNLELVQRPAGNDFDAYLEVGALDEFGYLTIEASSRDKVTDVDTDARMAWIAPQTGLFFARVRDQANLVISPDADPVGGPSYTYTLRATAVERPAPAALTLPAAVEGTFEAAGDLIFHRFRTPAGEPVQIGARGTGGASTYVHAFDAETLQHLGGARFGGFSILTDAARDILVSVGEVASRGGDGQGYTLSMATQQVETVGALPYAYDGTLIIAEQRDLFEVTIPANTIVAIRVDTSAGTIQYPELNVYAPDDLSFPINSAFGRTLFVRYTVDTPVVLEMSDFFSTGDGNGLYHLSIDPVEPVAVDAPPVAHSGTIAASNQWIYRTLSVAAGDALRGAVTAAPGLSPSTQLIDLASLQTIRTFNERDFVWAPSTNQTVLVAFGDALNRGMAGWTYDFSLSAFETPTVMPPYRSEVTVEVPGAKSFVGFDVAAGSVVTVQLWRDAASLARPAAALYLATGMQLLQRGTDAGLMVFYAPEAARYVLEFSDSTLEAGADHTYAVNVAVQTPTDLTPGDGATGAIDTTAGVKAYRVTTADTTLLSAVLDETDLGGGVSDIAITALLEQGGDVRTSPAGKLLFTNDAGAVRLFVLYGLAGPPAADVGFDLTLDAVDLATLSTRDEVEPNDDGTSTDAVTATPTRIYGNFDPNGATADIDWFPIDLGAGDRITFLTTDGRGDARVDTVIELRGPDQSVIASDDDGGVGTFSNLSGRAVVEAGTYFLVVRPFGGGLGDYSMVVDVTPAP